jgi:ATPase subunit of ABC transporter with duplicated ATPase domains
MSAHLTACLSVEGLSARLPDDRLLFRDLTFGFERGVTAIVGPNGSGKSTLLEILAGRRAPTSGQVVRKGVHAFLPQRPGASPSAAPETTPSEQVADLLGVGATFRALERVLDGSAAPPELDLAEGAWDLEARIGGALDRVGLAGLDPRRRSATLSGGERTRVALAGLLLGNPDVLLLDEPTNHLDGPGREAVHALVRTHPGAVILVTHDRALLRAVGWVLELGAGPAPHLVTGNLEQWDSARAARTSAAARRVEHARKVRDTARRNAVRTAERQARRNARGARSARDSNQPKILLGARERQAQQTTGRLHARQAEAVDAAGRQLREAREAHHEPGDLRLSPDSSGLEPHREVLRLDAVTVDGLFGPLSRRWLGPVRIAVTGPNGSGKSTLLRLVAGFGTPDRGAVVLGVPPGRVALLEQLPGPPGIASVLEHMQRAHPDLAEDRMRGLLARLLFFGDDLRKPLEKLSEGERVRLELARILGGARPPALVLLDEPTNHLDLDGVRAVESILGEFDGAVIAVSHDEAFVDALAPDEIVELGAAGDRGPHPRWPAT